MIGELESRQILALSRDGCTANEIAKALDVDESLVSAVLNRNDAGSESDRDINDEQLAALRKKAFDLAMYSEDDSVSARMTMFLIERDKPKNIKEATSITEINKAIIVANEGFKELLSKYSQ